MIDLQREELISLGQAAALLPSRPSVATLWRWFTKGSGGKKLETIKIGGARFTSREALERFAIHTGGPDAQSAIRSPRQRQRGVERAERELAADGI